MAINLKTATQGLDVPGSEPLPFNFWSLIIKKSKKEYNKEYNKGSGALHRGHSVLYSGTHTVLSNGH